MKFPTVVMPPLKFARYYASIGWPVFPLSPRKKSPATKHGFHDASTEEAQIESWWGGDNAKMGIGVPTGQSSGLIIVDIDARNGGWGTVERLKAEGKFLPDTTVQVNTSGSGAEVGKHYYFRFPAGHEILPGMNNAWPGIDIKSDGGYVCVPPTVHPTGSMYNHQSGVGELADLPDWVLERLQQGRSSAGKKVLADSSADSGLGSKVRQGQRNSHLTRVAGWLRRENHPSESIYATLWEINRTLCDPPVSEDEVRKIVWSVTRYAPNPDAAVAAIEPHEPVAIKFMNGGELLCAEVPEPDWILENRLAQGDICILCGAPEAGKSWFAMDLAVCTATMMPIYGLPPYFGRLRTMMLDEENTFDEIQRRFNKLCLGHGLSGEAAKELLSKNFRIAHQTGQNFATPGYLEFIVEQVREFQPHIIVIDSATAMSGIKNENDASEVRGFTTKCLIPLRQVCNSTIIVIHHTNKMAYQDAAERTVKLQGLVRGSIDWLAGADSSWLLMKEGEEENPFIRLHQAKQRRGFPPKSLKVRLIDTQEGGTLPIVFDLPAPDPNARKRAGKRSKTVEGVMAILGWLKEQEATIGNIFDKKTVLDQVQLFIAGLLQGASLSRKDLHNSMVSLVKRGIFTEVEDPSSKETSDKGALIRLTITPEQLVSYLLAVG